MAGYIIRRFVGMLIVLFIMSCIVFIVLRVLPGNPAQLILGMDAPASDLTTLEKTMGLNQPLLVQYGQWLVGILHGNLGVSRLYSEPVTQLIGSTFPVTLALTLLSLIMTLIITVPVGIWSAAHEDGVVDRAVQFIVQFGLAVPSFWVGIMLMLGFSVYVHWLPPSGYVDIYTNPLQGLRTLILPAVSIAIPEIAILLRLIRSSMVEVLKDDYMRTATSKGLSRIRILLKHAFRNAALAPLTLFGMQAAALLGGAIAIETIFAIPGIGRLFLIAIQQRDLALAEGLSVFIALCVVIVNFAIDLLYGVLDPRIRLEEGLKNE